MNETGICMTVLAMGLVIGAFVKWVYDEGFRDGQENERCRRDG